jgi:hypothetical protein
MIIRVVIPDCPTWHSSEAILLREQPSLNLDEFHGHGARFIIIGDVIDSCAHGIAPHQPGIMGLQQIGRRSRILPSFTVNEPGLRSDADSSSIRQ